MCSCLWLSGGGPRLLDSEVRKRLCGVMNDMLRGSGACVLHQLCSALMLNCAGYSDSDLPPPLCAAEYDSDDDEDYQHDSLHQEDKESSCSEDDEDYCYEEETDDTSKVAYIAAASDSKRVLVPICL